MEPTYRALADRILHLTARTKQVDQPDPKTPSGPRRILIALAGAPGSGKTTIATNIVRALADLTADPPKTVVISIDGFHLPLSALRALPNASEALARRGAPWTFDAKAAVDMVRKLRTAGNNGTGAGAGAGAAADAAGSEDVVVVPTFDHAVKDPVADGLVVGRDAQVCLIEGNYVLCNEDLWSEIADLVDERWLVRVDENLARNRVAARHLAAGIEPSMELALARTDYNDIPNGRYVMEHSLGRQDVLIESIEAT
ncbi:P-loop containing nucleoside triphosphate hydrolase protein [Xylariaceae sp. FL0662B]|nr:P-loop containing nucleoside triphosphate hydrolase protein [Xylariaceae sp. FL0662B]